MPPETAATRPIADSTRRPLGPSSVGPSSVGPSSVGPSSVGPSVVAERRACGLRPRLPWPTLAPQKNTSPGVMTTPGLDRFSL
jgi:hypothetical protein